MPPPPMKIDTTSADFDRRHVSVTTSFDPIYGGGFLPRSGKEADATELLVTD